RKCQSCSHCCFVALNPCDKALQLADRAGFHAFEQVVKLFSGTRSQHVSKLLDQLIRLIDFGMERPKQSKGFLVFSLQCFRTAQKQEHRLSCKHRRARKKRGCLGILPSFGKQANQLPRFRPKRPPFDVSPEQPRWDCWPAVSQSRSTRREPWGVPDAS